MELSQEEAKILAKLEEEFGITLNEGDLGVTEDGVIFISFREREAPYIERRFAL